MGRNTEALKQELIRLSQELVEGTQEERPEEELEKIRQRILVISFALSDDTRKIHDFH